ncbi:MAG TPA: MBL fold metallo-hydrolase [Candidatus Aphodovivens excrementavium]|nr:MBL fold metallo-hydrolase [Candidatus Aphodovivens excrementavium]
MFDHDPFSNVRVLTHSAIRMESEYGAVLYFDPYDLAEEFHDADVIAITHTHYDHFSPEDIKKVAKEDTLIVAPETCAKEVAQIGLPLITLAAGEATAVKGNVIHAVPAYNVEPERLGFHPQENGWLGYQVVMDDLTYYIAGDTDQNPDNETLRCDVALVPIGGTYTMDPKQAAEFVNKIRPRIVIPTHYGTAVGTKEDVEAFEPLVDEKIEVMRKMEWH